jgi:hypothetical protein
MRFKTLEELERDHGHSYDKGICVFTGEGEQINFLPYVFGKEVKIEDDLRRRQGFNLGLPNGQWLHISPKMLTELKRTVLVEHDITIAKATACTCTSLDLFRQGCRCGFIAKEGRV